MPKREAVGRAAGRRFRAIPGGKIGCPSAPAFPRLFWREAGDFDFLSHLVTSQIPFRVGVREGLRWSLVNPAYGSAYGLAVQSTSSATEDFVLG